MIEDDSLEEYWLDLGRPPIVPDEPIAPKVEAPPTRLPIQPLVIDQNGVIRFKANAIVRTLLDMGPLDLNALASMPFSDEDREQLAQLIGYSLSGFGDLSYVRDATFELAYREAEILRGQRDG